MIRQDYIMRLIEQLTQVLSKILFNKVAKNYQEAIEEIEKAFSTILGLDYNLIKTLSVNDIKSLLGISADIASVNIKYIIIAQLLKEKADLQKLIDSENFDLLNDYIKAVNLYFDGILNSQDKDILLDSYYSDVKEIIEKIREEIPDEIRFKLFKFYELIGEYHNAENELFHLKELNYFNIADEGIKFYRKLGKLSEIELQNGNFSKKKVDEGLAEFTQRLI